MASLIYMHILSIYTYIYIYMKLGLCYVDFVYRLLFVFQIHFKLD